MAFCLHTTDMTPENTWGAFFSNPSLWSPLIAWITAQVTKVALNYRASKRVDFRYLSSLGGMPSAHSATVSALATSVGINCGVHSQIFASTFVVAVIVMFDASTVRRAAGLQAGLLNDIVRELFKEHHFSERKMVELLGHTRTEVFAGLLLGVAMAFLINRLW
jgi:acid phosphatase family membrane protein YuiD